MTLPTSCAWAVKLKPASKLPANVVAMSVREKTERVMIFDSEKTIESSEEWFDFRV
jgi:hypothetical protein